MHTVHVTRDIPAPIEQVFELLSDHASYKEFPGIRKSTLTRLGEPDRNGVGALREIDAGKAWFTEEVTVFERPTHMEYKILKSFPPLAHQGGVIRLTKTPRGTHVDWTSTFRVDIPLVGGLLTPLLARTIERAFGAILRNIEQRLAA